MDRNEPLLPRSTSFGHGATFGQGAMRQLGSLGGLVSAPVRSTCLLAATGSLTIGLFTVLSPLSVLSPLHLLTCLLHCKHTLATGRVTLTLPARAACAPPAKRLPLIRESIPDARA